MQGGRGIPLEVRRPLLWLVATAALTLVADQLSKAAVRTSIGLNETITVISGVFDIVHVQNTGAAFGLLPGRRELFVTVSLLMLLGVAIYWFTERPRQWPVVIPLGLVVGGALGNLADRTVGGGMVTDFLSFSFFSPVYNLADSAIVIGVAGLIVWVFFGTPAAEKPEDTPGVSVADAAPDDPAREGNDSFVESAL